MRRLNLNILTTHLASQGTLYIFNGIYRNSPQRFRVLTIPRFALGLVGARTAGETPMGRVVSGHVSGTVAPRSRALQLLWVRLDLGTVRPRTPGQTENYQHHLQNSVRLFAACEKHTVEAGVWWKKLKTKNARTWLSFSANQTFRHGHMFFVILFVVLLSKRMTFSSMVYKPRCRRRLCLYRCQSVTFWTHYQRFLINILPPIRISFGYKHILITAFLLKCFIICCLLEYLLLLNESI